MRKVSILAVVTILVAMIVAAAPSSATAKKGSKVRWHGTVVRISKDGSVYTVRRKQVDQAIHVTADTKYTKTQGKKAVEIDKSEIKEGDNVICTGTSENKEFVAERIDKRHPR